MGPSLGGRPRPAAARARPPGARQLALAHLHEAQAGHQPDAADQVAERVPGHDDEPVEIAEVSTVLERGEHLERYDDDVVEGRRREQEAGYDAGDELGRDR